MKKFLVSVLLTIYAVIAIATTICLLAFNDYHVSEFGSTTMIIIDSMDWEPNFSKGDIAFVTKTTKVAANDEIFVYNVVDSRVSIEIERVTAVESDNLTNQTTYKLSSGRSIGTANVIGKVNGSSKMQKVGYVLSVLESKFGYLFLVVLPTLLLFLYELYSIVTQLRDNAEEDDEEEKTKKKSTSKKKSSSKKK